jgi:predicted ABC-type ATPase
MTGTWLDQRPILVAIAGPNGAGKTTFYHAHILASGLPLVNADVLAGELTLAPYEAARVADSLRRRLVRQRESFAFETVFSDPVGDKLGFLKEAANAGYTVVVCFVGLSSMRLSRERVAMRVSQGGHDVPDDKLRSRYPRSLANLKRAVREVPHVLVYDNSDLTQPYQRIATFENGKAIELAQPLPRWFRKLLVNRRSS